MTAEDCDGLLPVLDNATAAHEKINLLVAFEDMKGWQGLDTAKADLDFGTQQYRQIEKAAFVGDKKRQKWMIRFMGPFTRRRTERFFDFARIQEAWQWLKEG